LKKNYTKTAMNIKEFVFRSLKCPVCHSSLSFFTKDGINGHFYCPTCEFYYPYFDEIPKLIPPLHPIKKRNLRRISLVYDKYSAMHDKIYENPYMEHMRAIERYVLKTSLQKQGKNKIVLDIGCGTGYHAIYLSKKGYFVVCLDISREMLKVAREKARKENVLEKMVFIQADAGFLPFNDPIFDYILAIFGAYNHTKYYSQGFKQVHKILKTDGAFVFSVLNRWRIQYLLLLLKRLKIRKMVLQAKNPNGNLPLPVPLRKRRIYCHYFSVKELRKLLSKYFRFTLLGSIFIFIYPKFRPHAEISLIHKPLLWIEKNTFYAYPFNHLGYYIIVAARKIAHTIAQ